MNTQLQDLDALFREEKRKTHLDLERERQAMERRNALMIAEQKRRNEAVASLLSEIHAALGVALQCSVALKQGVEKLEGYLTLIHFEGSPFSIQYYPKNPRIIPCKTTESNPFEYLESDELCTLPREFDPLLREMAKPEGLVQCFARALVKAGF